MNITWLEAAAAVGAFLGLLFALDFYLQLRAWELGDEDRLDPLPDEWRKSA